MKRKLSLGERSILQKHYNSQLIKDYFRYNPDATKAECARDLGLSTVTVWKHCREIFGR